MHLRIFAANPTRKPNAAANSADAPVSGINKEKNMKYWYDKIVLQPCTACNLNCTYCYLPGRDRQKVMDVMVAKELARQLKEDVESFPRKIDLIWHGGEPLTTGVEKFTHLLEQFEDLFNNGFINHIIQTNGTLINDSWCQIFKKYKFKVGVSIDGDMDLNENRVDWRGQPSFEKVVQGLNFLKKNAISFNVIAVLSKSGIRKAHDFYNFFEELGCSYLNINLEEKEGINSNPSIIEFSDAKTFWSDLFKIWSEKQSLRIREFDRTLSWINTVCNGTVLNKEKRYSNIWPTISINGDFCVLSPELLTVDKKFIVGNILDRPLKSYVEDFENIWYLKEYEKGRIKCSGSCEYFSYCGGGYASNKYHENKNIDSTTTNYCKNSKIALVDATMEYFLT